MTYLIYSFLIIFQCSMVILSKCPTKVSDEESSTFNVQSRFDNLIKAIGTTELKTRFMHRNKEEYDYVVNICGEEEAVVQIGTDEKKKKEKKVIGRLNGSLLLGGEDWMLLQYYRGDKYNTHCDKALRQAWIAIRCEDQGEAPVLRVIEEGRYEIGKGAEATQCYYLFEYNHKYACSDAILNKLNAKHKLSGGAIFCIVILSFALAYLIFGFLYQRFVAQAKGLEQIPNFSFWKKVGNASADGCDFVCRREEHPNTYKGMADALDIDSSDDDKDDGLLPM